MAQVVGQPVAVGQVVQAQVVQAQVVGMTGWGGDLASVPQKVRNGQTVTGAMARDYANSIPYNEENHSGLYKVVCMMCNLPIGISLSFISGDCLFFPCICPFLLPCCCSCEREANNWVTRGKHGERTGMVMCIDEQKGTIANYPNKCCSAEPADEPCCYYYRIGRNTGPLAIALLVLSVLVHAAVPLVALVLADGGGGGGGSWSPCADRNVYNCPEEQCRNGFVASASVCLVREGEKWHNDKMCCSHKGSGHGKCASGYTYEEGGICTEYDDGHKAVTTCCYPD